MGAGVTSEIVLAIKNMVCERCVRVVREDLIALGYRVQSVELGKAVIANEVTDRDRLKAALEASGFELLEDKNVRIVEAVKTRIIEWIRSGSLEDKKRLSDELAKGLGRDYSTVSHLFSSVVGITIERYLILQKIEKVKEWLVYDDLTLSEISYKLGYSSVAHLSKQFKQVTGLTPSDFKKLQVHDRKPLDRIGR